MGLNDFIKFFEQRWQTMTANPGTFFGGFLAALFAGFLAGIAWQHQQVVNADTLAKAYQADVLRLQDEVDRGAALKERMETIDDTFSEEKVQRLESELGIVPTGEVEVVEAPEKREGVDQIIQAFVSSGWKVGIADQPRSGTDEGANLARPYASDQPRVVLITAGNEAGRAVSSAFEAADIDFDQRTSEEALIPQVWVLSREPIVQMDDLYDDWIFPEAAP